MRNKLKYLLGLALLLITNIITAQQDAEMADALRSNGKIYVVVVVLCVIFVGIVAYLISIDRKISKLENKENE